MTRLLTLPLLLAACTSTDDDKDDATPDALTVVETIPAEGADDVSVDTLVRVTFSGTPTVEAGADNVFLVPSVPGTYTWDADTLTVTFDPTAPLAFETPYTITIDASLGLARTEQVRFTTEVGTVDTDEPDDTDDTDVPDDTDPDVVPDSTWDFDGETAGLLIADPAAARRTYTLTTTAQRRDAPQPGGDRTFTELTDAPVLRSGSDLYDALFALSVVEADEGSVANITDGAFDNGAPFPCNCYETGELWTWVWTRDTAYAVDLGLAALDPVRSEESLRFKLARPKAGGDLRIVQDTGTGGSWPVSTDRAVWALGARQALRWLDPSRRDAFRDDALEAMAATIAEDRTHVFDSESGLYRGEQSFLDWREQSYATWTATDTVHIAMSRTLSTNVAHHVLLSTAAALGAETSHPDAGTWQTWADDLEARILAEFWDADASAYHAGFATTLDPTAMPRWELLGTSLAVLEDLGTVGEDAVRSYPHGPFGPPVFHPQQPDVPVYHNRGIWPFVTAYGLLAAKHVGNDAVFDRTMYSLVRGSALNLSNMENYEVTTQQAWYDDGNLSGPVVNSRRQLWSVAGYYGAWVRGVFGIEAEDDGLRFDPFVTAAMRDGELAGSDQLVLEDLTWQGLTFDVEVNLPATGTLTAGSYVFVDLRLDGTPATPRVTRSQLSGVSTVSITLGAGASNADTLTELDTADLFAPREPTGLVATHDGSEVALTWADSPDAGVTHTVFRDGVAVATGLTGGSWTDAAPGDDTPCYAIEAVSGSGLGSQHTPPACAWSEGRIQDFDAHALVQTGAGTCSTMHGLPHYENWGDPGEVLTVYGVTTSWSGRHLVQLRYGNGSGGFNSGITAANKRVEVYDSSDTLVGEGSVVLPQRDTWGNWGDSTFVAVDLVADETYRIEVHDGPNMSDLEHYLLYTAGTGGGADVFHRANVANVRLLSIDGPATPRSAGDTVALDGMDDIAAYPATQVVDGADLGATLETWSAMGVAWDDDFLYLSLVSLGFEEDFAPWMVYLEVDPTGPAVAGTGVDYALGTVTEPAALPFTPTHAITARAVTGVGPDGGPWNGVWRNGGASWQQLRRFQEGTDQWLAGDRHTLSVRVPRALLDGATTLRIASHLLYGAAANEWKELYPSTHTPWSGGGDFVELDLTAAHDQL